MPRQRTIVSNSDETQPMRPALTPEARENQMIALATDLAEQQLRDGTASSQVITHYLKLATVRELREREKLEAEIKLANAKIASLESQSNSASLYADAIEAFSIYSGKKSDTNDEH